MHSAVARMPTGSAVSEPSRIGDGPAYRAPHLATQPPEMTDVGWGDSLAGTRPPFAKWSNGRITMCLRGRRAGPGR